jgi:hypothetical protein
MEAELMTVPPTAPGLCIPFANPVEVFTVDTDNTIRYTESYKAVCYRLTAEGLSVLQAEDTALLRLVIGVHCERRLFFLPGHRVDFHPVGAGLFALHARFTTLFDPKGRPPKMEFVAEEDIESWVREAQQRRAPDQEKRKHERIAYSGAVALSGAPSDHPAFAVNISEGGIAMITTFPLKPNDVQVVGRAGPDGRLLQTKTRIVHCTPIIPRFYHVGGQFVK